MTTAKDVPTLPAVSAQSRETSINRSKSTTVPLFVDAWSLPKDYWDAVSQLALQKVKILELESKLEAKTAEVDNLEDKIATAVELLENSDLDELCGSKLIHDFDLKGRTEYLTSLIPAQELQRIFGSDGLDEHLRKLNYACQLSCNKELEPQYKKLVELGVIVDGYPLGETISAVLDILQDGVDEEADDE